MIDAHADPAFIPMRIVDAVGDGLATRPGNDEVVRADTLRRLGRPPRSAAILEGPHQFLLLGVDRDCRLLPALGGPAPGLRTRATGKGTSASRSVSPRPIVAGESPVARATSAMPPYPRARASVAAHKRRDRLVQGRMPGAERRERHASPYQRCFTKYKSLTTVILTVPNQARERCVHRSAL